MMPGNNNKDTSYNTTDNYGTAGQYDSSTAYTAAGQEPYGANTATKPTLKEKIVDMLPGHKNTSYSSNTTGATEYGSTGNTGADGQVCVPGFQQAPVNTGEKLFRVGEDHEVEKERVERWVEHKPVEREYVTKVAPTGKVFEGGVTADRGAVTEREVKEFTCYNTGSTVVQGVQGNPVDRSVM